MGTSRATWNGPKCGTSNGEAYRLCMGRAGRNSKQSIEPIYSARSEQHAYKTRMEGDEQESHRKGKAEEGSIRPPRTRREGEEEEKRRRAGQEKEGILRRRRQRTPKGRRRRGDDRRHRQDIRRRRNGKRNISRNQAGGAIKQKYH